MSRPKSWKSSLFIKIASHTSKIYDLYPEKVRISEATDNEFQEWISHRYRGEIPKLAAIFSRHGEQFGGIRFYSESACVNCIFLRYEHVFYRARKTATSATHIKVIARVICIAHSPHLFSAKSRIPPNCSPCREKNLRGRYWNFGISVSISVGSVSRNLATTCWGWEKGFTKICGSITGVLLSR